MILVVVSGLAVLMILTELALPGRRWSRVKGWIPRAILLNGVQVAIALIAGRTWETWLSEYRMWNLDGMGLSGQVGLGYLAITFLYYWWHRVRHHSTFLWRWVHQVHHSPARIEIITSFYKHPIELLLNSWLSASILYFIVGVSPEAAAITVLVTGVAELFYHWNVKTPYWLGFIIQRPESHCVHHECGLHAYNYADLPLWDMLFGTFRNPREWEATCGFGGDKEQRLKDMLLGRVVE